LSFALTRAEKKKKKEKKKKRKTQQHANVTMVCGGRWPTQVSGTLLEFAGRFVQTTEERKRKRGKKNEEAPLFALVWERTFFPRRGRGLEVVDLTDCR